RGSRHTCHARRKAASSCPPTPAAGLRSMGAEAIARLHAEGFKLLCADLLFDCGNEIIPRPHLADFVSVDHRSPQDALDDAERVVAELLIEPEQTVLIAVELWRQDAGTVGFPEG